MTNSGKYNKPMAKIIPSMRTSVTIISIRIKFSATLDPITTSFHLVKKREKHMLDGSGSLSPTPLLNLWSCDKLKYNM